MSDTIIQDARDVLAKWCKAATKLPWERAYADVGTVRQERTGYSVGDNIDDDDARLIVGTAGNPELWYAIDLQLRLAIRTPGEVYDEGVMRLHEALAQPIAAAIIAADERTSA